MAIIEGKSYDVIVCGSGSAGFCAAVQAARAGMKTAVVEKYGISGGIMTVLGNNDIAQFNAHQRRIIEGIGWEFVKELEKEGYAKIPDMTVEQKQHWLYGVHVNPIAAAKLIDDFLQRENVDIYYNQPVVDVEITNENEYNRVSGLIISTKSGLKRMESKIVIDCTGDGDVCAWAGAPFECGDDKTGELQPGTARYYFDNVDKDKKLNDRLSKAIKKAFEDGKLLPGDLQSVNMEWLIRTKGNNTNHISHFNSADSDSKTHADIEGRRCIMRVMNVLRDAGAKLEFTNCAPETAPRESRRIICDEYITSQDYINAKCYEDAVCYSFYPIDLHRSNDGGIYQIFLTDGQVPKIPLSAMIPKTLSNVFVAGRCASGDRLAHSAFRVKASCMAMGQSVGAAAAVAVEYNKSNTRGIDINKVKNILKENGAIVP